MVSNENTSPLIYYVRHGLTDWNAELRFQGRQDIPLNNTGRKQAKRNGKALLDAIGNAEGFHFYCSPLGRARETMEIIRAEMGLAPDGYQLEERLIERAYGEFEGISIVELERDEPEVVARRSLNHWSFTPRGGESLEMTLKRVAPFLDELTKPTVIVAHGAVGRTVRKHLLSLVDHEAGAFKFPQDKVFKFENKTEKMI